MEHMEKIAKVCHEVNRAYCRATGDDSQPAWENAPNWQRDSAINGVKFKISNPGATAEDMHQSWCDQKLKEGWRVGPVKNPETKEHPCLVDYDQLPESQRMKDYLFSAVVEASL